MNTVVYNLDFTGEELEALPTGSVRDWESARVVTWTMKNNGIPCEWALADSLGDYFAVCTIFGGHTLD